MSAICDRLFSTRWDGPADKPRRVTVKFPTRVGMVRGTSLATHTGFRFPPVWWSGRWSSRWSAGVFSHPVGMVRFESCTSRSLVVSTRGGWSGVLPDCLFDLVFHPRGDGPFTVPSTRRNHASPPAGDGPERLAHKQPVSGFPHPRAWSAGKLLMPPTLSFSHRVYGPFRPEILSGGASFPHPRGDGPALPVLACSNFPFSPPAWGWSGLPPKRSRLRAVFPTRVGMVRWLPRWV